MIYLSGATILSLYLLTSLTGASFNFFEKICSAILQLSVFSLYCFTTAMPFFPVQRRIDVHITWKYGFFWRLLLLFILCSTILVSFFFILIPLHKFYGNTFFIVLVSVAIPLFSCYSIFNMENNFVDAIVLTANYLKTHAAACTVGSSICCAILALATQHATTYGAATGSAIAALATAFYVFFYFRIIIGKKLTFSTLTNIDLLVYENICRLCRACKRAAKISGNLIRNNATLYTFTLLSVISLSIIARYAYEQFSFNNHELDQKIAFLCFFCIIFRSIRLFFIVKLRNDAFTQKIIQRNILPIKIPSFILKCLTFDAATLFLFLFTAFVVTLYASHFLREGHSDYIFATFISLYYTTTIKFSFFLANIEHIYSIKPTFQWHTAPFLSIICFSSFLFVYIASYYITKFTVMHPSLSIVECTLWYEALSEVVIFIITPFALGFALGGNRMKTTSQ